VQYFPLDGMKTHLDWSAYDTYGMGDAYAGIPATGGNYAKAVAVCMNNQQCQREGKGVMCPSYRITGDVAHSTQARVKTFKAALNGELDQHPGKHPFTHPELAQAMDLCVSCKGCKKECPSAVDMTLIKTEYLAQRYAITGVPLRARLFAGLPLALHRFPMLVRWLVNARNHWPLIAKLGERYLGISARRHIAEPLKPAPTLPSAATCNPTRGPIVLFIDTFTHYFEPEIADAAKTVLAMCGYQVEVLRPTQDDSESLRPLCCGRTFLSNGMVSKARYEAQRMMAALAPIIERGTPIIGLEPSCLLALRDEFYSLRLDGEQVGKLGKQVFLFEEFLSREQIKGLNIPLKGLAGKKALVHGHCHQKAFGAMKSVRKLLSTIPGLEFDLLDASCCGMSGSFGLEAEHFDASMQMAELALLPAIRNAATDTLIIADGFSCRHQILDGTGRKAEHVAIILRDAL
jgi:glycerol-3-phosphate dehydrogenase subunit C